MLRHARQESRDGPSPSFPYGGSKVTLQFVRLEGENLEIEAKARVPRPFSYAHAREGKEGGK